MQFSSNFKSVFATTLDWITQRIVEIFGIVIFLFALSTIIALISYSPEDISFNTAIDGVPSNLISYFGSYYSDIMFQTFGYSAYLFSLISLSFAYQLLKYHFISILRILSAIISCCIGSFLLYLLFSNSEISGSIGYIQYNILMQIIKQFHFYQSTPYIKVFLATLSFLIVNYGLFFSCNLNIAKISNDIIEKNNKFVQLAKANNRIHKIKISPNQTNIEFEKSLNDSLKNINDKIKTYNKKTLVKKISDFKLPSLSLLKDIQNQNEKISESVLRENAELLMKVLNDFGIQGEITGINPGPVVTLYELKPSAGIKSSRVIGLASDIARNMSAISTRVSVVPGKNAIGIEIPNPKRNIVYLRELLSHCAYRNNDYNLPMTLGKNISGLPIIIDLAKMPHLLIAGTTGSGKSVGINAMILSLIYSLTPDECRFIMIDPKMLELSVYADIPHLLIPVVTDSKQAVNALKWAVKEMESRYMSMSKLGVRNINGYNEKIKGLQEKGEELTRRVQTGFDPATGAPIYENQSMEMDVLPYIVIIVDEMADLMLVAGKEIEVLVQRLAQMARAAGIHLIMATQRPSADVVTGTIKANFPSRITFKLPSKIDSRVILGDQGAEQLLGQGDMLYMENSSKILRVHCPFVSDSEVENVTNSLKLQGKPDYATDVLRDFENEDDENEFGSTALNNSSDNLYNDALNLVLRERKASTSFIQRHLRIGYNRAATIMDMLEKNNVVSAANHVGKREVLWQSTGKEEF